MPFAAYLGRKLADGETVRVQQTLEDALRRTELTPEELLAHDRGGIARVFRGLKGFRPPPLKKKKKEERSKRREAKETADAAVRQVAHQLTIGWGAASEKSAKHTTAATSSCQAAFRQYLEKAAAEGVLLEGENPWRYVVTGNHTRKPEPQEIERWSGHVVNATVRAWHRDPLLRELVSQLNYESGFELAEALVTSSKDIARSIRWAVSVAVPFLLLGGGAVAVLVVLIARG